MIPRSLSHLFDILHLIESKDYTVRVSYLELYNEELFDLLSTNDESKIRYIRRNVKINTCRADYTRIPRKKGAIIIHGLEEVTINNKSKVSKLLERGSDISQTLSTLDHAYRAKNLTNRPEINQKLTQTKFLNQSAEEIKRLRKELLVAREMSDLYLADENYNEMQATIWQQTKEIKEKINRIKALEESTRDREKILSELELENIAQREELHEAKTKLDTTTDALKSTNYRLKVTSQERDEQKYSNYRFPEIT